MKLKRLIPQIELTGSNFSSRKSTSEIEVLHAGIWEHPQYGTIKITDNDIDKFIASFDNRTRQVDLAVDQEHMPEKGAAGWYKGLSKVVEDGKSKLKASIEWTKTGQQLIKDGIFKYFSPELEFDYEDLETHEHFENVLLGGALTNRPYFKSLAPVSLSENMNAGFTFENNEKGGERKMTKDELKAKLAEDSEFELTDDATDEDKAAYKEVKEDLAKEAEDKEEGEDEEEEEEKEDGKEEDEEEEKEPVKGSEKFISKAEHVKELNEMKSKMGVIEKKLQFKEVSETVQGYVFSESNPDGVLLTKNMKKAVEIFMAANSKGAKLFTEFLSELPKVSSKLFQEEGGAEGDADDDKTVEREADKLVESKKAKTYGEAVKTLQREKPELFK